jgi:antitoxin ParD1/3/4
MEKSMSRNTSVVIGKQHDKFIKTQIRRGRFGSASEAVRAGLSLLEEHELKVERLRQAIIEGEESGPAEPFDMNEFIEEMKANTA